MSNTLLEEMWDKINELNTKVKDLELWAEDVRILKQELDSIKQVLGKQSLEKEEDIECVEKGVDNDYISSYFRILWTKAVGTPDYNKSEWKTLANLLKGKGIVV